MNTLLLILLGPVGIGLAWLMYFRFSHEAKDFLLLVGLTIAILILLLIAILLPSPRPPTQMASGGTGIVATPSAVSTSVPESAVFTLEPITADTATPTTATTVAATSAPTTTVAATAAPTTTVAATAAPTAVQPTSTTAATPTSTPTTILTTVLTAAANIRSAPDQASDIVGSVGRGDQLFILGASDDWYLVRLGDEKAASSNITTGQGWIVQALVTPPTQAVPAITPTPGS